MAKRMTKAAASVSNIGADKGDQESTVAIVAGDAADGTEAQTAPVQSVPEQADAAAPTGEAVAADTATQNTWDLPSATGEVKTAEPEPMAEQAGASSSTSGEAEAATAKATETGEAAGKDETDILPAAGSLDASVAQVFAAQAGLDEKTVEAIKTQILGLPKVERRKFIAHRTVRHDGVRTARGGWLTLTRDAHASLAARDLVSKDWDNGVRAED